MDLPNAHKQLLLPAANNTHLQQSPPNNAATNPHLVYVRRKSEGTLDASSPRSTQLYCHEDIAQPKPFPVDSNYVPPSSRHTIANPKLFNNVHWEERYQQLQMFLRKLDQSDQVDYIQMLQSLSSVELSRHAVELEKRSIQLSLEEAKELQRVAALNVLGKSVKNFKAPADHGECSDKLKTST